MRITQLKYDEYVRIQSAKRPSQRPEFWLTEAEFNLPPITSLCLHLPSLQYRRVDEIYGGRASRAEQGEARGDEESSRVA